MRIAILITFLICSISGSAQLLQDLTNLLKTKNLDSLDVFLKQPYNKKILIFPKARREIVEGYNEQVVELYEIHPIDNQRPDKRGNHYKLYVLSVNKNIFYYQLIDIGNNELQDLKTTSEDKTIEEYRDSVPYNDLRNKFADLYDTPIKADDLFRSDIVYGYGCGIVGMDPPYLQKMTVLVRSKDLASLRQWLRSANTEKQLYAARAYRYLELKGYKTTEDEQRWLAALRKKKGFVYTCSGCIYANMLVSVELNNLKESSEDFLLAMH